MQKHDDKEKTFLFGDRMEKCIFAFYVEYTSVNTFDVCKKTYSFLGYLLDKYTCETRPDFDHKTFLCLSTFYGFFRSLEIHNLEGGLELG